VLLNNYVGTDATGESAVGNGSGIALTGGASGNTVGSPAAAGGNLVSGNLGAGVTLDGPATSGNLVLSNAIGTDAYGAVALGNGGPGVWLNGASGNTLGGLAAGEGNLISANLGHGVLLAGGASGNLLAGNYIGTDTYGLVPLGNGGDGVALLSSSGNLLLGNLIAFNGNDGVLVDTGTGNAILSNSITGHPGLGIELANGGNNGQPFPTLSSAATDGAHVTVQGSFAGAPRTTFTLEFFANAAPNASGYGEGALLLGSRQVVTDDLGNATFTFVFDAAVDPSYWVSSTATDPGNNTSQFSLCVPLSGGGDAPPPGAGAAGGARTPLPFAAGLVPPAGKGPGEGVGVSGNPQQAKWGPAAAAVDPLFAAAAGRPGGGVVGFPLRGRAGPFYLRPDDGWGG
jgi:titin